MNKHRVLLLSAHPLLSEGLTNLFDKQEDFILLGPYAISGVALSDLDKWKPDVILVAEQDADNATTSTLMIEILQHQANLPVIQVDLSGNNVVRVYRSHTLPARSADLIETIRSLPPQAPDHSPENS